jgi:hypothetical protein
LILSIFLLSSSFISCTTFFTFFISFFSFFFYSILGFI